MSEIKLKKLRGSGGYILAKVTEEQQQKGNLGGPDLFLAPIGRINKKNISKYYCNICEKNYEGCPNIEFSNPNERVADNLSLVEKGQYICIKCKSVLAEYREFQKQDDKKEIGNAKQINMDENVIKKVSDDEITFNSIINMPVYNEHAKKIGIAKQVGIDSSQSIVLSITNNDGKKEFIKWSMIKKIGEIILLDKKNTNNNINECTKCNFQNKTESKFCERCGEKINF